jgi:hypothetical protein
MPAPAPPQVSALEREVQSLVRMGRIDQALDMIASWQTLAKDPALAVSAAATAGKLYWSLDKDELAARALAAADRAARTTDDRRLVALTQAFGLERARKTGALAELYLSWERGDDPCLRTEGTRGLEPSRRIAADTHTDHHDGRTP